jgi:tetratricopeptide (TPR) repeat protein
MDAYDRIIRFTIENLGLPPVVVKLLADLLFPLIVYGILSEGFEKIIGIEAPAAQIWAACIALGLLWLFVCHHWLRTPNRALAALFGLLALVGICFFKVWLLHGNHHLRIPFLVLAALFFTYPLVFYFSRNPKAPARYLGLALLAVGAALLPEHWYFIVDSVFPEKVSKDRVGILIAPYSLDKEDKERANLRIELKRLIAQSALGGGVQVIDLPRPIPGYPDAEHQISAAKQIGKNNGAFTVVFGVAGSRRTYTYIALSTASPYLPPWIEMTRVDSGAGGPSNDARYVHVSGLVITGLLDIYASDCARAGQRLANADDEVQQLQKTEAGNQTADQAALLVSIRTLRASSIACELAAGTAAPSRAAEALALYDEIIANSKAAADLRLNASIGKGLIYRQLAAYESDTYRHRMTLQKAIDAYTAVLSDLEKDARPTLVAAAWQNLGVAYEKMASVDDAQGNLKRAEEAHQAALASLASGGRVSEIEADSARAQIYNNLGVVLYRAARLSSDQVADLERSIEMYKRAIDGWRALDISNSPRVALQKSNLADAYRELAIHKDGMKNLKRARDLLEDGRSAISGKRDVAVLGEILYKLGQVDTAIGDRTNNVTTVTLGMIEWVCALKMFEDVQLIPQALIVKQSLQERMEQHGTVVFRRMITTASLPENSCKYDPDQIMRRLEAKR